MNIQPYIVGLTGGIGSGKSTVSQGFQTLGITVVDADYASRAVVEPGMPALSEIAQHFGDNFLLANGTLDRSALRAVIFANAEEKSWLERLLHPLIRDWIVDQLQAAKGPYVILESPLLFETNQFQLVNTVLLIDLPVDLQLERACARDSSEIEQIQHIINSQMSREEKLSKADWIFDNSLNQDTMIKRIETLHAKFLALANSKN